MANIDAILADQVPALIVQKMGRYNVISIKKNLVVKMSICCVNIGSQYRPIATTFNIML